MLQTIPQPSYHDSDRVTGTTRLMAHVSNKSQQAKILISGIHNKPTDPKATTALSDKPNKRQGCFIKWFIALQFCH